MIGNTTLVPEDTGDPWILVTNDDGIDTPALLPLLTELQQLGSVRALVPAREYSWSSKTLSRFAQLDIQQVDLQGAEVFTVDGSPADCANVGVYNLWPSPPSLVVSGVNVGANAGLSFLLSSGTVGAAVEAMLSGIPAVASSLQMMPEDYERWRRHRDMGDLASQWALAAAVTREVVAEVRFGGMPEGASLVSINMPPGLGPETERVLTGVTETCYGPFFARRDGGGLEHEYSGLSILAPHPRGDIEALERGQVAITPLRFSLDVHPTEADRRRFERRRGGTG